MLGEQLDEETVGPDGMDGDRHWAVVHVESWLSLSARRCAAFPHRRSKILDDEVVIELPDRRGERQQVDGRLFPHRGLKRL
jgi:uncharacterized protein YcbX